MSYRDRDRYLFRNMATWAMIETMDEPLTQTARTTHALGDETQWFAVGGIALLHILVCDPIRRPSIVVWTVLLVFYGIFFLTGYLRVLRGSQTEQRMWLVVLSSFAGVYLPIPSIQMPAESLSLAVVVSDFFLGREMHGLRSAALLAFLRAQTAGLCLETSGCLASHGVSLNL